MARKRKRRSTKGEKQPELPPGVSLRHTLTGHSGVIIGVAVTGDGRWAVSGSDDKTLKVWDLESGQVLRTLEGHSGGVSSVALTPDGQRAVSASHDKTLKVWDLESGQELRTLEGHPDWVRSVAVTGDGRRAVSASDDSTLKVWDLESGEALRTLEGHRGYVFSVALTGDGRRAVSASQDQTLKVWDLESGEALRALEGHTDWVRSIALTGDGRRVVSGSDDRTVRLWDLDTARLLHSLEEHKGYVFSVALFQNKLLASKSGDQTIMLWDLTGPTPRRVATLNEPQRNNVPDFGETAAFAANAPVLVTVAGEEFDELHVWDLDLSILLGEERATDSVPYTTARLALVGDSGVGKTGLGYRLAHGDFKEHSSTHGQQFWVIDAFGHKRADGATCEAVLWDLAGQADYRIIHSLFLDDDDVGLLLFDPTRRENPLSGVEYWLKQYQHANETRSPSRPPRKLVLVGARTDRGSSTLADWELHEFCRDRSIEGDYIATSAFNGSGIEELTAKIREIITWDDFPTTITTGTFKRIKDYVLKLKEDPERKQVLVSYDDLLQLLKKEDPDRPYDEDEIRTAVGHLANHGYVAPITRSTGEEVVLLQSDLLVNLASSFVLEARRHPQGLGLLEEDKLLAGGYGFRELEGLEEDEREALLDAAAGLSLKRHIAFRETVQENSVLVAPSLINEKRPKDEAAGTIDDVSYRVSGAVENVYASLVVQLGYTDEFQRDQQRWQNHAQFEIAKKQICGFRQATEGEGEIELVLYYSEAVTAKKRELFQATFERFLRRLQVEVKRIPVVDCESCGTRQPRNVVIGKIETGAGKFFCSDCGNPLPIPLAAKIGETAPEYTETLDEAVEVADRRTVFEEALVWVKGFRRDRGDSDKRPSCFISYAWGEPSHEKWVLQLAKDLRKADVDMIFDRWHNTPGTSITKFIEEIESAQFVVAVGTAQYLAKYKTKKKDPVVAAEIKLINTRLRKLSEEESIKPLLLTGTQEECFPPLFEDSVYVDFRDRENHFVRLFELILSLYNIPFDHPRVDDFRERMQAERDRLARAAR